MNVAVSEVLIMRMCACGQLANNINPIQALFRFHGLQRTIALASYPGAQIMIDGLVRYQSISSNLGGIVNNSALQVWCCRITLD